MRVELQVKDRRATLAPDGWVLLQQARARFGIEAMRGVGLDHLVTLRADRTGPVPRPRSPPRPRPLSRPRPVPRPRLERGDGRAIAYARAAAAASPSRTSDHRRPAGPTPTSPAAAARSSRPSTPDAANTRGSTPSCSTDVDARRRADRLRRRPDRSRRSGPISPARSTASIDPCSGHGTFICGLIHQGCPDADIVAWRIVGSDGPIVESDLVDALSDIAELARRHRDGEPAGSPDRRPQPLDGLLPRDARGRAVRPDDVRHPRAARRLRHLRGLLGRQRRHRAADVPGGVRAVGRRKRARSRRRTDRVPIVSVGALNPNGTEALFSNTGPWVRALRPGRRGPEHTPPFQGGLQPIARTEAYQRMRESVDPDDFTGQFALWSGTSFAAPLLRGQGRRRAVGDADPDAGPRTSAGRPRPAAWPLVAALHRLHAMMRRCRPSEELRVEAMRSVRAGDFAGARRTLSHALDSGPGSRTSRPPCGSPAPYVEAELGDPRVALEMCREFLAVDGLRDGHRRTSLATARPAPHPRRQRRRECRCLLRGDPAAPRRPRAPRPRPHQPRERLPAAARPWHAASDLAEAIDIFESLGNRETAARPSTTSATPTCSDRRPGRPRCPGWHRRHELSRTSRVSLVRWESRTAPRCCWRPGGPQRRWTHSSPPPRLRRRTSATLPGRVRVRSREDAAPRRPGRPPAAVALRPQRRFVKHDSQAWAARRRCARPDCDVHDAAAAARRIAADADELIARAARPRAPPRRRTARPARRPALHPPRGARTTPQPACGRSGSPTTPRSAPGCSRAKSGPSWPGHAGSASGRSTTCAPG